MYIGEERVLEINSEDMGEQGDILVFEATWSTGLGLGDPQTMVVLG